MDLDALLQAPYTSDPDRRRLYPQDIYFREVAFQLSAMPAAVRERILTRSSFVVFKPEAVVGRRIDPALEFLAANGFTVLGALPVHLDARAHRELWRYQLNAAPLPIIRTVDMILSAGPSLFVAVTENTSTNNSTNTSTNTSPAQAAPEPATTAARRLGDLKGSSQDRKAYGGSLRGALNCTLLCLNFVHAPDEPADLIRELGVLFPARRSRNTALALLAGEPSAEDRSTLKTLLTRLHEEHPPHPLDPALALDTLRTADPAAAATLEDSDPMTILDLLEDDQLPLPLWDRITLAARAVDTLDSDLMPLIGPPPGERAEQRRARVAANAAGR